ncbi:MAG: LysM peptidoglycan-binding domain-containing protein [Phycisphaerae bacterium]|nr:LysM peptidoglycan-binding domain-containing protein [Phycisphaerae bacterium]
MTPNTKVGLLIGLVFIIGIGMLLSRQVGETPRRDLAQYVPPKVQTSPAPTPRARVASADLTGRRGGADTRVLPSPSHTDRVVTDDPIAGPAPIASVTPGPAVASHDSMVGPVAPAHDGAGRSPVADAGVRPVGPAVVTPGPVVPPSVTPPAPTPGAPLPAGWKIHKVAAGETLSSISTKHYTTCKRTDLILAANKDKVTDPHKIREGMELRIPPAEASAPIAPPPTVVARGATPALAPAPVSPAPALTPAPVTPSPIGPGLIIVPPSTDGGSRSRSLPPISPLAPMTPPSGSAGGVSPVLVPPSGPINPLDTGIPGTERRPAPAGPAPLLVPVRPGPGTAAMKAYQVKDGDTLSSIAAAQMGGRGQWRALFEANKDVISSPDSLAVGMTIKIPEPRVATSN